MPATTGGGDSRPEARPSPGGTRTPRLPLSERFALAFIRIVPEWIMAAPERALLNAACVLIGASVVIHVDPASVLGAWPRWASAEWGIAMLVGGALALYGTWQDANRSVARLGYLLIALASIVYGVALIVDFGWRGLSAGLIFLGIAVAKALRLFIGSAIRSSVLRAGRDFDAAGVQADIDAAEHQAGLDATDRERWRRHTDHP